MWILWDFCKLLFTIVDFLLTENNHVDSLWSEKLGRGHTNYDIQIIVVILKVTTRFFQQRPWIIGKNYHDSFGSHMPNMNYEVYCGSAWVELTQ